MSISARFSLHTNLNEDTLPNRLVVAVSSSGSGTDSMPKIRSKAGLLGLGKVGISVLSQHTRASNRFRLHWLCDSKRIYCSKNSAGFTKKDYRRIVEFKQHKLKREALSCEIYEFETLDQQVSLIRDLVSGNKADWVVFDSTFTRKEDDYALADAVMGCKAYCTGNKTAWADYDSFSKLLRKATETQTLLGLNCTVGVWLDQMEILPIMQQNLLEGQVTVLKRDNSSLNLFFAKIDSGLTVERTIQELENSGHLDLPGPDALLTEVKDQTMKAHIAANVCGITRSIRPVFRVQPTTSGDGPRSIEPDELAEWYLRGRRHGDYPALVSQINIDRSTAQINYEVGFACLTIKHPLARDFINKCAMSIDTSTAKFTWSNKEFKKRAEFMRSGYGGAEKTAARLIAEANRALLLSRRKPTIFRSPILVLAALEKGERAAKLLERELTLAL